MAASLSSAINEGEVGNGVESFLCLSYKECFISQMPWEGYRLAIVEFLESKFTGSLFHDFMIRKLI